MKVILSGIGIFAVAYLVGGINPAYILSKKRGIDIRQTGTGNAGATNTFLTFGPAAGILVALLDIAKAFLLIRISAAAFPSVFLAKELAGAGCILGHMLPIQMHFRGGKGLACLGGILLAYKAKYLLILLAAELLLVWITKYPVIIPITAAIVFPILYIVSGGYLSGFLLYSGACAVMEFKHLENIRRIREGTEHRIDVLWNRKRDAARVSGHREEGAPLFSPVKNDKEAVQ